MAELYERIEKMCKDRGISITEMCKQSGASRGSLTDLKMGRIAGLSLETLEKLMKYFDVSLAELMGAETKKAPSEDEAIKELASILLERPDLRGLLDVAKVKNPEDVEQVTELLRKLRGGG